MGPAQRVGSSQHRLCNACKRQVSCHWVLRFSVALINLGSTNSSPPSRSPAMSTTPIIVGSVVGSVTLVVLVGFGTFYLLKRRKQRRTEAKTEYLNHTLQPYSPTMVAAGSNGGGSGNRRGPDNQMNELYVAFVSLLWWFSRNFPLIARAYALMMFHRSSTPSLMRASRGPLESSSFSQTPNAIPIARNVVISELSVRAIQSPNEPHDISPASPPWRERRATATNIDVSALPLAIAQINHLLQSLPQSRGTAPPDYHD